MVVEAGLPLSQSAVSTDPPTYPKTDWDAIDKSFRAVIDPIRTGLALDETPTDECATYFSECLYSHLCHSV